MIDDNNQMAMNDLDESVPEFDMDGTRRAKNVDRCTAKHIRGGPGLSNGTYIQMHNQ
jgi:hypothetical protein